MKKPFLNLSIIFSFLFVAHLSSQSDAAYMSSFYGNIGGGMANQLGFPSYAGFGGYDPYMASAYGYGGYNPYAVNGYGYSGYIPSAGGYGYGGFGPGNISYNPALGISGSPTIYSPGGFLQGGMMMSQYPTKSLWGYGGGGMLDSFAQFASNYGRMFNRQQYVITGGGCGVICDRPRIDPPRMPEKERKRDTPPPTERVTIPPNEPKKPTKVVAPLPPLIEPEPIKTKFDVNFPVLKDPTYPGFVGKKKNICDDAVIDKKIKDYGEKLKQESEEWHKNGHPNGADEKSCYDRYASRKKADLEAAACENCGEYKSDKTKFQPDITKALEDKYLASEVKAAQNLLVTMYQNCDVLGKDHLICDSEQINGLDFLDEGGQVLEPYVTHPTETSKKVRIDYEHQDSKNKKALTRQLRSENTCFAKMTHPNLNCLPGELQYCDGKPSPAKQMACNNPSFFNFGGQFEFKCTSSGCTTNPFVTGGASRKNKLQPNGVDCFKFIQAARQLAGKKLFTNQPDTPAGLNASYQVNSLNGLNPDPNLCVEKVRQGEIKSGDIMTFNDRGVATHALLIESVSADPFGVKKMKGNNCDDILDGKWSPDQLDFTILQSTGHHSLGPVRMKAKEYFNGRYTKYVADFIFSACINNGGKTKRTEWLNADKKSTSYSWQRNKDTDLNDVWRDKDTPECKFKNVKPTLQYNDTACVKSCMHRL